MNKNRKYMNTREVAEMYGIAEYTVREWAKKGTIPAEKIGKQWYFPIESTREHVEGEIMGDMLKEKEDE